MPGHNGARKWYSTSEAALALGVTRSSLVRRIRSGKLQAIATGPRSLHVTPEALEAHVRALAAKGRSE